MRYTATAFLAALSLALLVVPSPSEADEATGAWIDTIAGGGPNNVPALAVNLGPPSALVCGAGGELFVASVGHHSVFHVDGKENVTRYAGTGHWNWYIQQNLVATDITFWIPRDLALEPDGDLLILDQNHSCVWRVDAETRMTSRAVGRGWFMGGYGGDGYPAVNARMGGPSGMVLAADGTLYIADTGNQRIRVVDPVTGLIDTLAGTGVITGSVDGEGGDGTDDLGDGGPVSACTLKGPSGLAIDAAGDLYVADSGNNRVRKIDMSTKVISTVAGNGAYADWTNRGDGGPPAEARIGTPSALAFDAAGNLYIQQVGGVRYVDWAANTIATVAGGLNGSAYVEGVPATQATMRPWDIALDPDGHLLIADTQQQRIRKVDKTTNLITPLVGGGLTNYGDGEPAVDAILSLPFDVEVDPAGNVYVCDYQHRQIRRIDAQTGIITTIAGTGESGLDDGPALQATFQALNALVRDAAGTFYIGDGRVVRKLDAATQAVTTIAGSQSAPGAYETDMGDGGPALSAVFGDVYDLALGPDGALYVADGRAKRIRRIDLGQPGHPISTFAGTGIELGSIDDAAGGDPADDRGDGGPAQAATFGYPAHIDFSAAGDLYVGDGWDLRIRKIDHASHVITTAAGNSSHGWSGDGGLAVDAGLYYVYSMTVDPAGNIFISAERSIRRVDALTNIIEHVAGTGFFGYGGDGGPALQAQVSRSHGMRVNAHGDLIMAETFSNRIRKLTFSPGPPQIEVEPTQVAFGSVRAWEEVNRPVVIRNVGASALTVTGVALEPAAQSGFQLMMSTATPLELAPNAEFTVTVAFEPVHVGATTAKLRIDSDDPDHPVVEIPLSGTRPSVESHYDDLIAFIEGLGLPHGPTNSLIQKLKNSKRSWVRVKLNPAVNLLNAFLNQIDALRGTKIPNDVADEIHAMVEALISMIGGP